MESNGAASRVVDVEDERIAKQDPQVRTISSEGVFSQSAPRNQDRVDLSVASLAIDLDQGVAPVSPDRIESGKQACNFAPSLHCDLHVNSSTSQRVENLLAIHHWTSSSKDRSSLYDASKVTNMHRIQSNLQNPLN